MLNLLEKKSSFVSNEKKRIQIMKKLLVLLLLLTATKAFSLTFEVKPTYFYPQDKVFRSIYGTNHFMMNFELDQKVYNYFHLFLEVGYLNDNGVVKAVDADTEVTLVPLTFGAKFIYNMDKWNLYGKIGPNWVWAKAEDHYPTVKEKVTKNVFGGTIGVGAFYQVSPKILLDLFVNYLYDRKTFRDNDLRIKIYGGGLQAGFGLGYTF